MISSNTSNSNIKKFDQAGTNSFSTQTPNKSIQYSRKTEDQNSNQLSNNENLNTKNEEVQSNQINILLNSVLNGEQTIESVPFKDLPNLIQALKEDRDNKIIHKNNTAAEKSDEILFSARQCYNKKMKENALEVRIAKIDERISNAKKKLSETKRNNLIKSEKLEELHKKQIHELGQRQMHETEQLRNSWNSIKYQRMFNKPSPELRTLQLQATLLQRDRTRQQEQIKAQKQAMSLIKIEKNEKSRLMNAQYNESVRNLERKQKSDLNTLLQKQKVQTDELRLKETQEIRTCEMQLANLIKEKEKLINPSKAMKRFLPDSQNDGNQTNQQNQDDQNQTKPYYADFTKLTLPSLPSTSPRRLKMKAMRYKNS